MNIKWVDWAHYTDPYPELLRDFSLYEPSEEEASEMGLTWQRPVLVPLGMTTCLLRSHFPGNSLWSARGIEVWGGAQTGTVWTCRYVVSWRTLRRESEFFGIREVTR